MTEQRKPEDGVLTRIGQATMLLHAGDREEARNRLGELWAQIGTDGDPLHRSTLAHYLADAQDDPDAELAWDLRALTAAECLGGERPAGPAEAAALRALYPTLHLSLAADYVKLRRPDAAWIHLDRARAASDALEDDGYGHGVRAAIDRLETYLRGE
ncbi:hypothetical protein [Streptomyces purpureus]|uniref:Tetratricopeptide repeat protein n=1 Tax=Streptomyces purpureus TaxID=1951 RepID=A0A918LS43_9ACTN|nr:hypothetical protein [Streptomyces purpureus]GGT42120.1 hypothetical protein GCM10014713_39720 [Streptomyces purpureus]